MAEKKQLQLTRKDFIQSLKQLRYFYNNLKEVHAQFDMTQIQLEEIEQGTKLNQALEAEVLTQEQILQSPEALQAKDERLAIAQKFQKNQK